MARFDLDRVDAELPLKAEPLGAFGVGSQTVHVLHVDHEGSVQGRIDPRGAELLAREARASGRLVHPNIVAIFDFGREALTGCGPPDP